MSDESKACTRCLGTGHCDEDDRCERCEGTGIEPAPQPEEISFCPDHEIPMEWSAEFGWGCPICDWNEEFSDDDEWCE